MLKTLLEEIKRFMNWKITDINPLSVYLQIEHKSKIQSVKLIDTDKLIVKLKGKNSSEHNLHLECQRDGNNDVR